MVFGEVYLLMVATKLHQEFLLAFLMINLALARALLKAIRFSGEYSLFRILSLRLFSLVAIAQSSFHHGLKYLELISVEVFLHISPLLREYVP